MSLTMEEIRAKYPMYDEVSDADLLKALHSKHYADKMSFNDFSAKVGVSAPEPEPQPAPQQTGIPPQAIAVANELARNFGLTIAEGLDMVLTRFPNELGKVAGVDLGIPSIADGLESLSNPNAARMEDGLAKDLVSAAGKTGAVAYGMLPAAGRNLARGGDAALDFLGFGSAAPVSNAARVSQGLEFDQFGRPGMRPTEVGEQRRVLNSVLNNDGDTVSAGYRLATDAPVSAPAVVADQTAKQTMNYGFSDGLVALAKTSSSRSKERMRHMLRMVEAGHKNLRNKSSHRPWHVVGDAMIERYNNVLALKKQASDQLDSVAKGLKGSSRANPEPAYRGFLEALADKGVDFNRETGRFVYGGSDFEGADGAQKIIDLVMSRMWNAQTRKGLDQMDAYDLHRFKKFIDEQVSYGGSQAEGLKGTAETIVKKLRHDIDTALDTAYDNYNAVNSQYSETRTAIDEMNRLAGKTRDLTGENGRSIAGKLGRRISSNAMSGDDVELAVAQLDEVSRKYLGASPDDDVVTLVEFANELDSVFGPSARSSLLGEFDKALGRTGQAVATATGNDISGNLFASVWNKMRTKELDVEGALKAFNDLLAE